MLVQHTCINFRDKIVTQSSKLLHLVILRHRMGTKVPIASQKFLLSKRDEVHFLSLT